ncbi:amino acid adenylation domain-containing protein [Streptomyces uncialis]|uniref:amino acid adenylation domain-containing protein n=1 Tax=Streptomyces uncialis TaxID=1048205 RepID=UPI0022589A1D|nr:amino acid adenylation domain-containing protein [Streptomyces uncialis]MCX4658011.1 amino acid adenylation domain-containing protein [Streptomyces uncialis]
MSDTPSLVPAVFPPLPLTEAHRKAASAVALSRTEPYDLRDAVVTHVERHAERTPGRPAVEEAGRTVGYGELADEARRAASALAARGVGPGQVVAVGGERGSEVVTAFLALEILGAVYLPVDAGWPSARVEDVLADSAASCLITTGRPEARESLVKGAEAAGCPTLRFTLDEETAVPTGRPLPPAPDEIRYVLYTSGSTGRPKGALVEHQGMLNHLWAKVHDLGLGAEDRLAQTAPLGFDISVWQMLAPLLTGGVVQIYTDDEAQDGAALLTSVVRRGTTVLEVVPTLIRFLLDARDTRTASVGPAQPEWKTLAGLRWMIATGEELPPALARRWLAAFPTVGLLNAYGPTECSDDVTHARLVAPAPDVRHLPIGGPIGNVTLYVLRGDGDSWLSCPRGEAGELFVGGVAVGRGYLGDPLRTAETFHQDPFTGHGRVYRTGDAVRVLPSGELEYLGRVDRQVKLGGVRMELAEIEAVLGAHPAVTACAVTVHTPEPSAALVARETGLAPAAAVPPRLVGHVVSDRSPLPVDELRAHLADRLPQAMVPSVFVELAALPLTRNGKTDHAALPPPPRRERPAARAYDAPHDPTERHIAAVVAELLGTGAVGRDETFLELGGDSLLAMRLLARLRVDGTAATLRDVLGDGSPAALAALATDSAPVGTPAERRPAPSAGSASDDVPRTRPLTPQQEGVYFHWCLDPDSPNYSYQGSLVLDGPLDHDRLSRAWDLLLEENPVLLARFAEQDDRPVHSYPHWRVPLPAVEHLGEHGAEERLRRHREEAADEAARPFALTSEPPLRLRLFALGDREHRLLVTMHEILLDGWGATVLFRRLAELYLSARDRTATADPERTAHYDHYLDWHEELLRTPEVAEAGAYWHRQLAGELPVLDVAQRPRPKRPTYRGRIVEAVLTEDLTTSVRESARRIGGTSFSHLLAAYALALAYYGDTDEVMIGAPMASRDRPEQADVPAFMLSMLPLRIAVDPGTTIGTFAERVRDVVLDGYAASDHPFGWTLRDLPATARSGSATPVFQTMLNMLAYPAAGTTADGVTFRFVELDTGYTKYDCALYVQPHGPGELLLQFAYQPQLMDEDVARNVLESTLLAARALVQAPGTATRALNLLPDAKSRYLVSNLTTGGTL